MPTVTLRIPMIGEGLQEARVVALLKLPGDPIRRDEPIYQMETDKAVMDVESPVEGTLVSWAAEPDQVLAIGAPVCVIDAVGDVPADDAAHVPGHAPAQATTSVAPAPPSATATRRTDVPPRTRAYAKEKGLTDDQLAEVPASGSKLMPADIDTWLASQARPADAAFEDKPLPQKQRVLNSRLVRGNALAVPGTMTVVLDWAPVEAWRSSLEASSDPFKPSVFTAFAFAVAHVLPDFPALRSSLVGEDTVRTFAHADLGIAVALPGDELVLAVVERADALEWRGFAEAMRAKIDLARAGQDQASASVTVSLTNMQRYGIRDAVAVVVPPAVATIFLGEPYNGVDGRSANMGITFDHRLLNGVGGAQFLAAVKAKLARIAEWAQ